VQEHPAVDDLPARAIALKAKVVHNKIAADRLRQRDQGRDHFDCRPDRIDDGRAFVKRKIRGENVIHNKRKAGRNRDLPDIRAEQELSRGVNDPGRNDIFPYPDFNCPGIGLRDILPDASLNMFIVPHFPQIIAMHIHIFWDSESPAGLQAPVKRMISSLLGVSATVSENPVRVMGFSIGRKQVDATALLDSIHAFKYRQALTEPVLLVVNHDLYTAGHSFVFGLAREQVGAAVVSAARLENEYYGKPGNDDDTIDRLTKEGAHEIGHLFGLGHCTVPECIMFKPDTLDELDRKKKMLCPDCRAKLEERIAAG